MGGLVWKMACVCESLREVRRTASTCPPRERVRTDLQLHVLRFQLYQLLHRAFALAQGKEIRSASRGGVVRVVRDEGVEIAHLYKCGGRNSRLVEHFLPEGKSGEACSAPWRSEYFK